MSQVSKVSWNSEERNILLDSESGLNESLEMHNVLEAERFRLGAEFESSLDN